MFKLWRIAVRDLGRNKRRSALTMIAVAMGLALVIALHGYEMGAIQGSIEDNIRVQTSHVQVRGESYDADKVSLKWEDLLEDPLGLVAQAQMLAEVRAAAPVLWASGILGKGEVESVRQRPWHTSSAMPPTSRNTSPGPSRWGPRVAPESPHIPARKRPPAQWCKPRRHTARQPPERAE